MKIESVDSVKITSVVVDDAGYDTTFWAQFGLSMLVEVVKDGVMRRILLDTGLSHEPLLHNMEILGVDPKSIDFIFMTHCHYDHTGGLGGLLKKTRDGVILIAHPTIFRLCYTLKPTIRYIGITHGMDRNKIEANKGHVMLVSDPFQLIEGVFSTGEVERTTSYEPVENVYELKDGEMVQDHELDDMSLIVNVKDRGLVILTGCSHAGIVNIMKHSRKITGVDKIVAVIGGFHLRVAEEKQLINTVEELASAEIVCAGHCTGFKAMKAISDKLDDRFSLLQCGTVLKFGG